MNNNFSDLSNEELIAKLEKNLKENNLLFEEVIKREETGELKKINDYWGKNNLEKAS